MNETGTSIGRQFNILPTLIFYRYNLKQDMKPFLVNKWNDIVNYSIFETKNEVFHQNQTAVLISLIIHFFFCCWFRRYAEKPSFRCKRTKKNEKKVSIFIINV